MENQIVFYISLIVSLTVHEFSHAFAADKFGDPTPRSHGRVSLNPLRHLDPVGTIMLLFAHFGWGKPVPIDPYNLTKREETMVALAGPFSNFLLAILFSIIFHYLPLPIFITVVSTNLILAVFNLLPLPPLDGSKVLLSVLPDKQSLEWQQAFDQYGLILLIALLFLPLGGSNFINLIMSPIISLLLNWLL